MSQNCQEMRVLHHGFFALHDGVLRRDHNGTQMGKWVPVEAREDGLYTTGAPGNCEGEGRKLSDRGEAAG